MNTGVSAEIDHDTAEFAVETIRRWWRWMGRKRHPTAQPLLITADAGGSNGSRLRFWKTEIRKLADPDPGIDLSSTAYGIGVQGRIVEYPVDSGFLPPNELYWHQLELQIQFLLGQKCFW
jgi:hypothetical protein